jgi:hypothetical protein
MFAKRYIGVFISGLALAALLAAPAHAAEVDKYLPGDTEIVLTVNVKQLLGSAVVQKRGLDKLQALLKDNDEVQKVLTDLGLDPFKDIDRVTVAGPGTSDNDKGLVIVHGRFDRAKFQARAEEAAKENADVFKIHQIPDGANGKYTVYELTIPDLQQTVYAALADRGPLVFSPGKDYVVSALNKAAGREKAGLKNKALQALLEKADHNQSVTVTALGSAVAKVIPADAGKVKDIFDTIEAITGGVTLAEDLKIQFALAAKDAAAARDIDKALNDGINQSLGFLALLATTQKQLVPLVDLLKSIRVSTKDRVVIIKGELSADALEKAFPKDK